MSKYNRKRRAKKPINATTVAAQFTFGHALNAFRPKNTKEKAERTININKVDKIQVPP